MVRTSGRDCAGIAPDCAAQFPREIAGGFVFLPVAGLMHAWRACRYRPLGVGDFRAWLAMREMVARRQAMPDGREAAYGLDELANLLSVTRKRAGASVRRLEAAGLIEWSDSAIVFYDQLLEDEELLEDTIGRGKGSVAIPRRILRYLVAGARPAIIATALGVLLRCLSRRKGGWDGRGRVKSSWIARTFGVSIPAVKIARRELAKLGWITPEPSDQRAENRWGRAFRIDLGWSNLATSSGPVSIPPRPDPGPSSIPPDLHREPLQEFKDQEPASGGPAGVEIREQVTQTPELVHADPAPAGMKPVSAIPAPTLNDVQVEDLKDTGRTLQLYDQAIDRKLVTSSEADRMRFVGAAEHALAIGKANPPGLFAWIVRGRCWRYLTGEDEDRANARVKAHIAGLAPSPDRLEVAPTRSMMTKGLRRFGGGEVAPPSSIGRPALSADARLVKAVREASIRAGVFRDPFPAVQSRDPRWTRERWDMTLRSLGLA
jgi:hypothetical protein